MSVDIACAYLGGISRETFLSQVASSVAAIRLADGVARYDRRHIDAWVDSGGQLGRSLTDTDWLATLDDA